jgi:hypothetical protein
MTDEERSIYEAAPEMEGNHPAHRREVAAIMAEHERRMADGYYGDLPIGGEICANAVRQLRELLPTLTSDQRLAIFADITEGYCDGCGTDNPDCQCQNDE